MASSVGDAAMPSPKQSPSPTHPQSQVVRVARTERVDVRSLTGLGWSVVTGTIVVSIAPLMVMGAAYIARTHAYRSKFILDSLTVAPLLTALTFFFTAFLFLIWLNAACSNARDVFPDAFKWSPGWAVGCFFVPVINLLRPFIILQDLHRESLKRAGQQPKKWPALIWWLAAFASGAATIASGVEGKYPALWLLGYAFSVVSGAAFVLLVRQITRAQMNWK
jgi:hypothetical protein